MTTKKKETPVEGDREPERRADSIGVVLFDDPKNPGEGWTSVDGQEASRVRSTAELRSDKAWVTNLDFGHMRDAKMNMGGRYRMLDWPQVKLTAIAAELGVDIEANPSTAVPALSAVIARIARISSYSGLPDPTKEGKLLESIQSLYSPDPKSYGANRVDEAIANAYHPYQTCEGAYPDGGKFIALRYNRVAYAQLMQTVPLPSGRWQVADTGDFPEYPDYQWLVEQGSWRPALAAITVEGIEDPGIAGLISFDVTVNNEPRRWAPVHEVAQLVALGVRVRVDQLIVAEGVTTLDESYSLPQWTLGGLEELSLSAGIVAQNWWMALATPRYVKKSGKRFTPRAAWLRAWDRLTMLRAALGLHRAGFHVSGYGSAQVHVVVPPALFDDLLEHAKHNDLVPQTRIVREVELARTDEEAV